MEDTQMTDAKTLEIFEEYEFVDQDDRKDGEEHQLLGGEIWYN